MSQDLTEKQRAFADFLLTDPEQNQTKAYKHAYPKSSDKAAEVGGSKLVRNPKVMAYLAAARAARSERTKIDADWLLTRLAAEADADLADIYDANTGALKPVHSWPKIWRQGLVAGVKTRQERTSSDEDGDEFADIVEVKLSDRTQRLKMIGEHIDVQAFKQQVEHNHTHRFAELDDDELDRELQRLEQEIGE